MIGEVRDTAALPKPTKPALPAPAPNPGELFSGEEAAPGESEPSSEDEGDGQKRKKISHLARENQRLKAELREALSMNKVLQGEVKTLRNAFDSEPMRKDLSERDATIEGMQEELSEMIAERDEALRERDEALSALEEDRAFLRKAG